MPNELQRFFQHGVDMHWFEHGLGWTRETQKLVNERVDAIDFVTDEIGKCLPEIRILVTFR